MMPANVHPTTRDGLPATPPGHTPGVERHLTRSFRAMGCQMALTLDASDADAGAGLLDLAYQTIESVEQGLSRFRPGSQLSQANAQAGAWQTVSPLLATVLGVALQAARRTRGLCSPTLLRALEAAGYTADFGTLQHGNVALLSPVGTLTQPLYAGVHPMLTQVRPLPRGPRQVVGRRLRAAAPAREDRGWRAIRTADLGRRVWLPRGVQLDLAGVAKGWTADRVADLLAQAGPCLVDAGGDLAARGAPAGLHGWPVAVASPHSPDADLSIVFLHDAGIATSGVDHRRWTHGGVAQHHLIDPRTGRPALTDALSVSVIATTTLEADIEAKTALVLGVQAGLARLTRLGLAGLIVRRDGQHIVTPRWSNYVIHT